MVAIRPEKFSKFLCKGYLVYPAETVIKGLFLKESYITKYQISMDNKHIFQTNIPVKLRDEILKTGANLNPIKVQVTAGKNSLFGIPVQVRKIREKKKLVSIMVRVDGKYIGEVAEKLQKIQNETLRYFSHKPKTCMWDKLTPDKISITEPVDIVHKEPESDNTGVLEEVKKLRNKVEDLQDEVLSIHKPRIQKMINDTRDVQQGVLK